ncbi:putative aldouronate transport system permease protein [Evansella vedderi]|uniref:Aldouronate transport system permease protein n=1 Tax=Evansella vedderi TaxID=38282 RepID=A0ABU0A0L8_9BACI|nr:carbohydrate ABC transporter permease [Evansella vedderi]MDQ0255880.1 putative aldouronate transport system permease protein [Evansella vedderi]
MKDSKSDKVVDIINYFLLVIVALLVIYPLLFVLSASLSDPRSVINGEVWLWPKGFTLDAYAKLFQNQDLIRGFVNTFKYTSVGTIINIVLTIMAAYPLSRRDFVGRNVLMAILVFTMFFSGGLIPLYLLIRDLGMLDTFWVMVIPNAVSIFNIIIMRTFFQSIPWELQEASIIDGCSNIQILTKIILPLSMPVIAVMVLFYSVGHWNSYFNALIYLTDRDKFPLQLILREILIQSQTDEMIQSTTESIVEQQMMVEGLKYAVLIVSSLPMLILYPFLQRYFVTGLMIGSIKG